MIKQLQSGLKNLNSPHCWPRLFKEILGIRDASQSIGFHKGPSLSLKSKQDASN